MANPKLPTELKILKGTYNSTREKQNKSADVEIAKTSVIVKEDEKISVPKTITTKAGRKFYKQVVENLKVLHVLSRVDLSQIETMTRYLERIHQTDEVIRNIPIEDVETLQKYSNIYNQLTTRFDNLAAKFYITPAARVQLKLNELNAIRTKQEITKNDNAINNLLNMRKVSD